jgi:hypothetical protein
MSSEIATVSIPESVNKAIASLQAAQTYFEKGEALRKAEIVFEQLDQFIEGSREWRNEKTI